MDTKELLQLAAKACGVEILAHADGRSPVIRNGNGKRLWSPLEDDGDALRLAVKLGMGLILPCKTSVFVEANKTLENCKNIDHYAATRRAIVRAAAEIVKGMEA